MLHLRDTHQPTDTPGPLISISNSYKLGEGRVENTRAIVVSLATITKNTMGWKLRQRALISQSLEVGKPRMEVLAGLVSGEDSPPGLQMPLCPHIAKRAEALVSSSLIPSWGLPP